MNEREKLKEAEYFLRRMTEVHAHHEALKHNLSAFLSASRSVFQYAFKETNRGKNPAATPEAQDWYERTVTSSDVLKFFTGIRNKNIHDFPVEISISIHITITEVIRVSESVIVVLNGKKLPAASHEPPAKVETEATPPITSSKATFPDWPGPEDILQLCRKYLDESIKFVEDGNSKGYLT